MVLHDKILLKTSGTDPQKGHAVAVPLVHVGLDLEYIGAKGMSPLDRSSLPRHWTCRQCAPVDMGPSRQRHRKMARHHSLSAPKQKIQGSLLPPKTSRVNGLPAISNSSSSSLSLAIAPCADALQELPGCRSYARNHRPSGLRLQMFWRKINTHWLARSYTPTNSRPVPIGQFIAHE